MIGGRRGSTCEDGTVFFNIEVMIGTKDQRNGTECQVQHSPAERDPERKEEYDGFR